MISMLFNKSVAAVSIVAALAATHYTAYTIGKSRQYAANADAANKAVISWANNAISDANKTIAAIQERAKNETIISIDAMRNNRELERLRRDLSAARAAAASNKASTNNADPGDELLAAMAADIATLAERGAEIAAAADRHAADTVMMAADK